ncbi:MAG: hypothetical protein MMC33_008021 [Icmadophila ericetorum]|nr:hypothetical protein [Icmadophila ericetorum]
MLTTNQESPFRSQPPPSKILSFLPSLPSPPSSTSASTFYPHPTSFQQAHHHKLTKPETRAIVELHHFLKFCLAIDYLAITRGPHFRHALAIPTEADSYYDFGTPTHQWQDLSRYLKGPQTDGQEYVRWSGLKTCHRPQREMGKYLAEIVFAPANWLGLDAGQVLQRLEMYWPANEKIFPRSVLVQMAEEGRWKELAEKVLRDELCFRRIFEGTNVFDKTAKEVRSLEELIGDAMRGVRESWFTVLEWQGNGKIRYEVTAVPQATFAEAGRGRVGGRIFQRGGRSQAVKSAVDTEDMLGEIQDVRRLLERNEQSETAFEEEEEDSRQLSTVIAEQVAEQVSQLERQLRRDFIGL